MFNYDKVIQNFYFTEAGNRLPYAVAMLPKELRFVHDESDQKYLS